MQEIIDSQATYGWPLSDYGAHAGQGGRDEASGRAYRGIDGKKDLYPSASHN